MPDPLVLGVSVGDGPVLGDVWLVSAVGLFIDIVPIAEPVEPAVEPVEGEPQGRPLAPTRPDGDGAVDELPVDPGAVMLELVLGLLVLGLPLPTALGFIVP